MTGGQRAAGGSGRERQRRSFRIARPRRSTPDEDSGGTRTRQAGTGVAILDHGFWSARSAATSSRWAARSRSAAACVRDRRRASRRGARLPADVPGARVPSEADVYLPIEYGAAFRRDDGTQRRSNYLAVVGRARYGVTAGMAVDDDLRRIGTRLQTRVSHERMRRLGDERDLDTRS